jgi:hypothetical protein
MIRRLCCIGALVAAVLATSIPTAHAAAVPPSKWAPKFCTALKTWVDTTSQKAGDVESSLSNVSDLQTARDQLVRYLGEMASETQDAINALKKAGTPATPNGGKIAALFVKAFQTTKSQFVKAKDDASNLSTTDASSFATDGGRIATSLSRTSDSVGKSFDGAQKLDKGKKLENALRAERVCAFLGESSST